MISASTLKVTADDAHLDSRSGDAKGDQNHPGSHSLGGRRRWGPGDRGGPYDTRTHRPRLLAHADPRGRPSPHRHQPANQRRAHRHCGTYRYCGTDRDYGTHRQSSEHRGNRSTVDCRPPRPSARDITPDQSADPARRTAGASNRSARRVLRGLMTNR
jgi:hypothetical protein